MRNLHRFVQFIHLLISISIAAGLVCYDCKSIVHPRDCRRVSVCGTHEECYVESRINSSGIVVYDLGCSPSSSCQTSGKRSAGIQTLVPNDTQIQKRSDIVICKHCCKSSSYCNQGGCDVTSPAVSLANRTSCMSCQYVESPDKCEFTQLCNVNQVCFTEIIRINGEDRYRLGCVEPTACTMDVIAQPSLVGRKRFVLGPRRTHYCGKCCQGGIGNCNRDLCRRDGVITHGTSVGSLMSPPPQRNCEDIDTYRCNQLLQTDPDACLNTTISNYDCRRTCRCSAGSSSDYRLVRNGVTKENPDCIDGSDCYGVALEGGTSVVLPKTDCFYESSRYKGVYRTTSKGELCIKWANVYGSTVPHGPGFPDSTIKDAENKCRDPLGKGHPWCYTSQGLAWDYCDVPYCEECYYPGHTGNFTGYISKTFDNRTCEPWTSYKGQNGLLDSQFPDGSAVNAGRYCRDPFGVGFLCIRHGVLTSCDVKKCQGTCHDDPNTNCALIKTFVCSSEYIRKTLCPKTCGYCDVGLLPPRQVSPPVRAACVDVVGANCPVLKDMICKDVSAARKLCPKTCNVGCDVHPDATVASTTQTVPTQITAITTHTDQRTTASTVPVTTKQPEQCHDDPAFKCNPPGSPEIKIIVCTTLDPELSASLCPKTCGYCDGCKDVLNCSSQSTKDYFCSDDQLAIMYCKRSCRKCLEKTIPVKLNSCGDPAGETNCRLLDRELCICKDLPLRPICEHFCRGDCADKPINLETNNSCNSINSNTTQKRTLMRQYLGRSTVGN